MNGRLIFGLTRRRRRVNLISE